MQGIKNNLFIYYYLVLKGFYLIVFSRDVTVGKLASLTKRTVAILVSPTNPPGVEFYSYANVFFCLVEKHDH